MSQLKGAQPYRHTEKEEEEGGGGGGGGRGGGGEGERGGYSASVECLLPIPPHACVRRAFSNPSEKAPSAGDRPSMQNTVSLYHRLGPQPATNIYMILSGKDAHHAGPVFATSSTAQCTGAHHVIPRTVHQCSPCHPPHNLVSTHQPSVLTLSDVLPVNCNAK
jgi:hypothetical protein